MVMKRRPPAGNVRRVRSTGRNICGTITNKAGRIVQFESQVEHVALVQLNRDRRVRDFATQFEMITWHDEVGHQHSYTPDIIVWYVDGSVEVQEITISARRTLDELYVRTLPLAKQRKIRAAVAGARRREDEGRRGFTARGWRYVVRTEHDLPGPTERANLLALAGYRGRACGHAAVAAAARARLECAVGQTMLLADLIKGTAADTGVPTPRAAAALYHLIWQDDFTVDLYTLIFRYAEPVPGTRVHLTHAQEA